MCKPLNVGLWFHYDYSYLLTEVINKLAEKNCIKKIIGFVLNKRYFNYIETKLYPEKKLIDFYDLLTKLKSTPSKEAFNLFREYDTKYFLSKAYYSDRFREKIPFSIYRNIIINWIFYFNNIVKEFNLDVFLFPSIETSFSLVTYFVLKENNIPVLLPIPIGLDNRFYIASSPYHNLEKAYKIFNLLKKGQAKELKQSFLNEARIIIKAIREEEKSAYKDKGSDIINFLFGLNLKKIKKLPLYLYNYYKFYRFDYTQPSPIEKIKTIFHFQIKKAILKTQIFWDINNYNQLPSHFVLYPLQLYPEATTLIVSPFHQLCIIKEISKRIPLGWYLLVKEHPTAVGIRPLSFYREIKKLPNVLLVNPYLNNRKLIKLSQIVFSLNGTPILESIILKKPVIFTGPSRFDGFQIGIRSTDILNFDKLIQKAVSIKYDESDIVYMIISLLASSYSFNFNPPSYDPTVLDKKNIEKIAEAFEETLMDLKL